MKRTTILFALGLAACATTTTEAADWNNGAGGIKDHGGMAGVPVPAPIPVMESFSWYVRTDLGYAVKSSGDVTTTPSLGGVSVTQDYDSNEGPFHGGIGFGRYMTNSLRWDVTGDYRGPQKTQSYTSHYNATTITAGPTVPVGGTSYDSHWINNYNVARSQEVRMANHTLMMNLYYDFNRGGGFNPYVGIGAGLTAREVRMEFHETGICTQSVNDLTGVVVACAEPRLDRSGKPSSVNFGLAAAAMLGFTYEVRKGVLVDTGYRASWQGGNTTVRPQGSGDVISGSERIDHELRAGLRFNVW